MSGGNLADLKQRLFTSSIGILLLTLMIAFASHPLLRYAVVAFITLLITIALWEYFSITTTKGFAPAKKTGIFCTVLYTSAVFLSTQFPSLHFAPNLAFLVAFFAIFICHFFRTHDPIPNTAITALGFVYIAVSLTTIIHLLYFFPEKDIFWGQWWLAYLLAVTKVTDIGAYFFGRMLGKRKLAPKLSPGKTVEGLIGGCFTATITSLAFYYFSHSNNPFFTFTVTHANSNNPFFTFTVTHAIFLGFLLAIFGQLGDLAESLLKRDAGVKDSNVLPGLGGILDSVDSLIFTAPIILIFLEVMKT